MPEMIGTFFQGSARRHGMRHAYGSYTLLIGLLWAGVMIGFWIGAFRFLQYPSWINIVIGSLLMK